MRTPNFRGRLALALARAHLALEVGVGLPASASLVVLCELLPNEHRSASAGSDMCSGLQNLEFLLLVEKDQKC